jgi:hypothetical protein
MLREKEHDMKITYQKNNVETPFPYDLIAANAPLLRKLFHTNKLKFSCLSMAVRTGKCFDCVTGLA